MLQKKELRKAISSLLVNQKGLPNRFSTSFAIKNKLTVNYKAIYRGIIESMGARLSFEQIFEAERMEKQEKVLRNPKNFSPRTSMKGRKQQRTIASLVIEKTILFKAVSTR